MSKSYSFINQLLQKSYCAILKGHSTPVFILALLEKSKRTTENGNISREILVSLSMAFVCIPHDLAIAELNAHGFILKALKLINRRFSKKHHRQ